MKRHSDIKARANEKRSKALTDLDCNVSTNPIPNPIPNPNFETKQAAYVSLQMRRRKLFFGAAPFHSLLFLH